MPYLLSIFNENYSSFQTLVFPALVSFFILSDNSFDFGPIFKCHIQRKEKVNWIARSRTLFWIFWKKKIIKKSNIQEASQTLKKIYFLDYLRRKDFYSRSTKILISLITGEPVFVYITILMITKIYVFLLLYFTPVLLLIMWSQPASIAWTVTSTTAFYHWWNTQNILIYELDVLYIFYINIVCPYEICEFIWFLIW